MNTSKRIPRQAPFCWIRPVFGCFAVLLLLTNAGCLPEPADNVGQQIESDDKKTNEQEQEAESENKSQTEAQNDESRISLFDGESLDGWEETQFGGEDLAEVVDGELVVNPGYPMAGINRHSDEDLPKSNYEIELEAKRIDGTDFFCGLTFPVKDSHCTFVVAGWAGATVGLSCIDNFDASENDTTCYMDFENGRWYKIKVLVTDEKIVCWIDDEEVIYQELEGRKISLRPDILAARPLGISAFECKVAYRNITLKKLSESLAEDSKEESDGVQGK